MSATSWMRGGEGTLLLTVSASDVFPSIKVFDIRDPNFVGVEYSGDKNDRQAQPRVWWEERLRKADTPPPLPRIQPRTKPAAQGASPSVATAVHAVPPAPAALRIPTIQPRKRIFIKPRVR